MKIIVRDTFDAMSKEAAKEMMNILRTIPEPLICTASGASPAGLYKELSFNVKAKAIDTSNWYFVGLDEWGGMNGSDENSSRHQLDHQLFFPLNITEEHICFFDGRTTDREAECNRVDDFINDHNGIDIAILGIGTNGHIAMNEPGTPAHLRSHVAAIHESTQQIGQKYFKEKKNLETGLTLGLATLMESKYIFLLASGTGKAESIFKMLNEPIDELFPATLLRDHKGLYLFLDAKAASLLK
jgi:galactosamine-6-phosphate isomerase